MFSNTEIFSIAVVEIVVDPKFLQNHKRNLSNLHYPRILIGMLGNAGQPYLALSNTLYVNSVSK